MKGEFYENAFVLQSRIKLKKFYKKKMSITHGQIDSCVNCIFHHAKQYCLY